MMNVIRSYNIFQCRAVNNVTINCTSDYKKCPSSLNELIHVYRYFQFQWFVCCHKDTPTV